MKLTRHNGRAGKNGTYNPKHNDRSFDMGNSDHIDAERERGNLYWDIYQGLRNHEGTEDGNYQSFEEIESRFYEDRYRNFADCQNARNVKNRHPERNRSTEDILKNKKTCPEETVYQIGTLEEHVSSELLQEVVSDFFMEMERRFGKHVHILDWALHLDESTPHIHERHVFDCENKYGELEPKQEKALEELGIDLPDPDKAMSRRNNRKMTFDKICRALLFEVAKKYGLSLEEEPEYGGREYLEKQDYILMKQKEKLIEQEEKLEEMELKVSDMESLLTEVSDTAYEKAVELVTENVRKETRQEDIRMIEQMKEWLKSPERKAPKEQRNYALSRMDDVLKGIYNSMKAPVEHLKKMLLQPMMKDSATKDIRKKAKDSVLTLLHQRQERIRQEEERRQQSFHHRSKKDEMEH